MAAGDRDSHSKNSDSVDALRVGKGTVLVVEDERDITELLRHQLVRDGYRVNCVPSGEEAVDVALSDAPDLVLLDLMLPGIDGLEVCRRLRNDMTTQNCAIVMVSAKGEEADIVAGLELGADDYITKPFSPRVLLARVKAVLRRQRQQDQIDKDEDVVLRVGPLVIRSDRHEVTIDGEPIELTAGEFRLLRLMVTRPGRVFTRRQIIEAVQGALTAVTDRSVDVQVVGLRRKLGNLGGWIKTVRAVGYRFEPQVD